MTHRRRTPGVLRLKITLQDTDPAVWRRVLVHSDITLHGLHRIIQLIMEWYDYHLYEFTVGGKRYEAPDPEAEGLDATRVTLGDLALKKGDRFTYLYDFGDDWLHEMVVEARHRPSRDAWLPWLLAGERAGPPEDCGGVHGFEEFLEAIRDPEHPEHEAMRAWAGKDYDPAAFDVRAVRHALVLADAWGALKEGE
jgi:hypothetical protein